MKAFVFLSFSILIHCCIFSFPLLENRQESLINKLFLSKIKNANSLKSKQIAYDIKKKTTSEVDELMFFPPKKLNKKAVSKLNYRDGLIYKIQSKASQNSDFLDFKKSDTVVLNIVLNKIGIVTAYRLHEKSKYSSLNDAALTAVKDFKAYKPLPKNLHPKANFLIPIHFH